MGGIEPPSKNGSNGSLRELVCFCFRLLADRDLRYKTDKSSQISILLILSHVEE